MSSIRIVKGLPISFLVKVKDDSVSLNINDGNWTTTVSLHHQTDKGPSPFALTTSASGFNLLVSLTSEQTSALDHLGTGYVLVTRTSKTDDTVHIKTDIPVSVVDGL